MEETQIIISEKELEKQRKNELKKLDKQKLLDQFFTKPEEAKRLIKVTEGVLKELNYVPDLYIEPSAGSGSFLLQFPQDKRIGIDIDPKLDEVILHDFLKWEPKEEYKGKKIILIGNPPFGRAGKIATQFINHSTKFADIIAFIVPMGMKRWHCQHHVSWDLDLVHQEDLNEDIFQLPNGKKYKLFACFQVWVKKDVNPQ
jgi:hypothetical protein